MRLFFQSAIVVAAVGVFFAFGFFLFGWPTSLGAYVFCALALLISYLIVRYDQKKRKQIKESKGPGSD